MSRREKLLAQFAPINEKAGTDRRMRIAVLRAQRSGRQADEFSQQQTFDRAILSLVQNIPASAELSEWFRNEKLIPQKKRGWKKTIRNPVVLSIALALLVILGVAVFVVLQRMHDFPSSSTARKLLTIASSMRDVVLDPVEAEAGSLGDFFFMKYRLEHYDVPPEFAELRTSAVRVFDDDEGHRVAQITVPENRMQFFLFPAERDPKNGKPFEFPGWRYVEHEGWTGAVRVQESVCFMAVLRGEKKALEPYLAKTRTVASDAGLGR